MTDPRADPSTKPTVQMPSEGQRALARAIVEEFRPVIQQEVANGMLQFNQRLTAIEDWRKTVDAKLADEPKADITGKFDLPTLQRKRDEAAERVQRKLQRLEMESVAARAIERAESRGFSGFMQKHGWKGAIAAGLILFQLFSRWFERTFFK